MKVPFPMLLDYVETSLSAQEIGDLLTMAGFELEGIEDVDGTSVFDIKVMSNRGDGLSVMGLSREILAKSPDSKATALYDEAVAGFPQPDDNTVGDLASKINIQIETEDCHRFAGRMFEGYRSQPSPGWLQNRLSQAGMRSISLIVDITNYVMLELGQPLHAYDYEKISDPMLTTRKIIVRKAIDGEKLITLNGDEHKLKSNQMMICDAEKPIGVAGVMGGLETEVSNTTSTIFLEAANFLNTSVRKTRKQMGLNTEASYRFERSVDPNLVVAALNRVAGLLVEIDPSIKIMNGVSDLYKTRPEPRTLEVRVSRAQKLLGVPVSTSEAVSYLTKLGFAVQMKGNDFMVTVPTWRPDIVQEYDVIEEIGRVHGFDRIPETLPIGSTTQGGVDFRVAMVDALREKMLKLGFDQAISHSLRNLHAFDSAHERVGPRTPASPEMAYLRNSLLPSLSDAARRNGGKDLHVFEIGRCFWQSHGEPVEQEFLSIISQGALYIADRANEKVPSADFYSLKGAILALAPHITIQNPDGNPDSRFHPTRHAVIPGVGVFGQIHPDRAAESLLPTDTVMAELNIDALIERIQTEKHYSIMSRNPSVRRDIAFVISKSLPYSQIENAIELACGDVLEDQKLFDVYEGTGIPEGKHSLAIALKLRKHGENFTDEEANQVKEKAVAALEALGAKLRS